MKPKNLVIIIAVVLLVLLASIFIWFSADSNPAEEPAQATFTPPPISEDPPMSGDDIDNIMRDMSGKSK